VRTLAAEGVLAVPGTGFGRAGYIRLSLTIPLEQIKRSIPGFARAWNLTIKEPKNPVSSVSSVARSSENKS
jgi:hypothetical protein